MLVSAKVCFAKQLETLDGEMECSVFAEALKEMCKNEDEVSSDIDHIFFRLYHKYSKRISPKLIRQLRQLNKNCLEKSCYNSNIEAVQHLLEQLSRELKGLIAKDKNDFWNKYFMLISAIDTEKEPTIPIGCLYFEKLFENLCCFFYQETDSVNLSKESTLAFCKQSSPAE